LIISANNLVTSWILLSLELQFWSNSQ